MEEPAGAPLRGLAAARKADWGPGIGTVVGFRKAHWKGPFSGVIATVGKRVSDPSGREGRERKVTGSRVQIEPI